LDVRLGGSGDKEKGFDRRNEVLSVLHVSGGRAPIGQSHLHRDGSLDACDMNAGAHVEIAAALERTADFRG
jgi:hypothetical protein